MHLRNEHMVVHRFAGILGRGFSITKYAKKRQVETPRLRARHEELAAELLRRGMRHDTPMGPFFDVHKLGEVTDTPHDCRECREKMATQRIIHDHESRGVRVVVKEVSYDDHGSPRYVVQGFIDHRLHDSLNGFTVREMALDEADVMEKRLAARR